MSYEEYLQEIEIRWRTEWVIGSNTNKLYLKQREEVNTIMNHGRLVWGVEIGIRDTNTRHVLKVNSPLPESIKKIKPQVWENGMLIWNK